MARTSRSVGRASRSSSPFSRPCGRASPCRTRAATTPSRVGSSRFPWAKPHPPLWIGGWGDLTLKRAATLADNWIPGPTADLTRLLKGKQAFLDNRRAAGRTEPITEWPLTRDVIIAETDKKARELAEQHIMISYRREYAGGWRHPFIDAAIATDLDKLMADRFIIGGPDQCVAQIRRFAEEYGMTHLICRTFFPGMPHAHIMRELELIAREVMPAFR